MSSAQRAARRTKDFAHAEKRSSRSVADWFACVFYPLLLYRYIINLLAPELFF